MKGSGMTPEDLHRSRSQRIRAFTIAAILWVAVAGAFAIIDRTTTLDGFTGMTSGMILALFFAIVAVVLRRKQSRGR
jgi:F0F1-type ATP synthase assembly protein I